MKEKELIEKIQHVLYLRMRNKNKVTELKRLLTEYNVENNIQPQP